MLLIDRLSCNLSRQELHYHKLRQWKGQFQGQNLWLGWLGWKLASYLENKTTLSKSCLLSWPQGQLCWIRCSVDLIYSVKPAIWWHRMRSKIVEHQCANEIKGNLNDSDCHIMLLKKKQLCINVQSFPVLWTW